MVEEAGLVDWTVGLLLKGEQKGDCKGDCKHMMITPECKTIVQLPGIAMGCYYLVGELPAIAW